MLLNCNKTILTKENRKKYQVIVIELLQHPNSHFFFFNFIYLFVYLSIYLFIYFILFILFYLGVGMGSVLKNEPLPISIGTLFNFLRSESIDRAL